MKHASPGDIAKEQQLYDGRDESLDTNYLNEEKLLDVLETIVEDAEEAGEGIVMDFHMTDIFPERWFDLILVLRTSTEVLFDRLTKRGYSDKKRDENMQCEIMQVILDECREAYDPNIVHEVPSNNLQDMESNVARIADWSKQWIADHGA